MTHKLHDILCERIRNNPIFDKEYKKLLISEFKNKSTLLSTKQIKQLVEIAAIFSLSNDFNLKKLALKICNMTLRQYGEKYPVLYNATEIILSRLGDAPSIELMNKRYDYPSGIQTHTLQDLILFPEILNNKISNKKIIADQPLFLTNFQSSAYEIMVENNNIAISAPTSAGKSFVICNYILTKLLKFDTCTIVYVVPTNALIAEVQNNIVNLFLNAPKKFENIMLYNSAEYFNINDSIMNKKIYILTQERLQNLIKKQPNIHVDLLVIDEAQKIKDLERGPILENTVADLLSNNPTTQIIISAPFVKNPTKFLDIFSGHNGIDHSTDVTPVSQNIFFVKIVEKSIKLSILIPEFLCDNSNENTILINEEKLPKIISAANMKKAFVLDKFIDHSEQTLIYCDTPKRCREAAQAILNIDNIDVVVTDILKSTIEFIKNYIHEDYYLIDYLKFGIGYHYGPMPYFLKEMVKQLFEERKISVLCCTSTLLEGVNLPAKNIILYKPRMNNSKHMDEFTIKNLAGRAGRLRHDYHGNVYCINIDEWDGIKNQPFNEKLEHVESSMEKVYREKNTQLIDNLNLENNSIRPSNIDNIVKNLIIKFIRDPDTTIKNIKIKYDLNESIVNQIEMSLIYIKNRISDIDPEIIYENKMIDPRLQHNLYHHLINMDKIILPLHVNDPNFENMLENIFNILNDHVYFIKNSDFNSKYYAMIASDWIRQKSYRQIYENGIKYHQKNDYKKIYKKYGIHIGRKIYNDKIIKDIKMKKNSRINDINLIIEKKLKFKLARGLHCYCTLIKYIIDQNEINIDKVKINYELPFQLEFGAYEEKMLLLLELGLSRTTAIIILEIMDVDVTNIKELIIWLRDHQDKIKMRLHPYMMESIRKILYQRIGYL